MSLEGERPPKPVPVRKPDWLVLLVALATMMVGVLGALALFLWWLGSGLS